VGHDFASQEAAKHLRHRDYDQDLCIIFVLDSAWQCRATVLGLRILNYPVWDYTLPGGALACIIESYRYFYE